MWHFRAGKGDVLPLGRGGGGCLGSGGGGGGYLGYREGARGVSRGFGLSDTFHRSVATLGIFPHFPVFHISAKTYLLHCPSHPAYK